MSCPRLFKAGALLAGCVGVGFGIQALLEPQARAQAAVCIGVDTRIAIDRLPYRIRKPGSYAVVRDLLEGTGPGGLPGGITVEASHVTIDLNGYALRAASATITTAIEVLGPSAGDVTVRNGSITGWNQHGIKADGFRGLRVEDVTFSRIGEDGVTDGDCALWGFTNCVVNDCIFKESENGLRAGAVTALRDSTAESIHGIAFQVGYHSTVTHCLVDGVNTPTLDGTGFRGHGAGVILDSCVFRGCDIGAEFFESSNNQIRRNMFEQNGYYDLLISSTLGGGNRIEANMFGIGGASRTSLDIANVDNIVILNSFWDLGQTLIAAAPGNQVAPLLDAGAASITTPFANIKH